MEQSLLFQFPSLFLGLHLWEAKILGYLQFCFFFFCLNPFSVWTLSWIAYIIYLWFRNAGLVFIAVGAVIALILFCIRRKLELTAAIISVSSFYYILLCCLIVVVVIYNPLMFMCCIYIYKRDRPMCLNEKGRHSNLSCIYSYLLSLLFFFFGGVFN